MLAKNSLFYTAGLGFLALAKAKHALVGYSSPKPITDVEGCAEYDIGIAQHYLDRLAAVGETVEGKRVLELGPGSDLGVGILLLKAGAASYTAFDRFPLAENAPSDVYERLHERASVDLSFLTEIRYEVEPSFNLLRRFHEQEFDLALSIAAFEHFDDVEETLRQLHGLLSPDALLLAEIDLQTHSRWIREADPNNIYRYPRWLYRMFSFPGQPNRVRPTDYLRLLSDWRDVRLMPANQFDSSGRSVNSAFRDDPHLDWLSFVLAARH